MEQGGRYRWVRLPVVAAFEAQFGSGFELVADRKSTGTTIYELRHENHESFGTIVFDRCPLWDTGQGGGPSKESERIIIMHHLHFHDSMFAIVIVLIIAALAVVGICAGLREK